MAFASKEFILYFLPIFILVYYLVPERRRVFVLLAGSIVFLAAGSWVNPVFLLAAIIFNYIAARLMGAMRARYWKEGFFAFVVVVNIAVLFAFKWPSSKLTENIGLPLGISFYTFSMIAYLADVYKGAQTAEKSFLRFAAYGFMFPKIAQGPITKYGAVSKPLKGAKRGIAGLDRGLKMFAWGLILKVLLADKLAILWNDIANIGYVSISVPLAWLGAATYSLQLYFDFYGYSLMAVGLGYMLGYRLPDNFDVPYSAVSIREFYRKWHITLSSFFKEYVYIPLGGSKRGMLRTLRNILAVWVLTALWHGIGINFLIWGMLLSLFIIAENLISRLGKERRSGTDHLRMKRVFGHIYVCVLIPITWICFALTDTRDLFTYLGRMFGILDGVSVNPQIFQLKCLQYGWILAAGILLATPLEKRLFRIAKDRVWGMAALAALFWIALDTLIRSGSNPFMYLNF